MWHMIRFWLNRRVFFRLLYGMEQFVVRNSTETATLVPLLPLLKTWLFKSATPSDFFRIETKWGMVKKESTHIA
jgi:hypothetical protein